MYCTDQKGDLWLRIVNVNIKNFVDTNKYQWISFVLSEETKLVHEAFETLFESLMET